LAGAQFESIIQGEKVAGEEMAKLYNYYGTSLLFVSRDDLATPAYETSIEIMPNAEAWIGLGNAAILRHDWYAAERAYEQALSLAPYDPAPYCGLGILFARDHDVARAVSAHRQAVALSPYESVPYAMLGLTFELTANLDGAREAYANAAQYSGPNAGLLLASVERADYIVRNPPTPVPTATPRPIPTETPIPEMARYMVKSGDTLSAIAAEFGVTTKEIMEANRLTSEDFIVVGRTLIIPEVDD
jgi:tetratricopeptide (TPR) repeat protein